MSVDLIIRLKGEIQDSNFDAWRLGLIERIKAADRQLVTDEDFITADKEVKAFKVAERVRPAMPRHRSRVPW